MMNTHGQKLIEDVISLTGLPPASVRMEIERLLKAANVDPNAATISDLRDLLANYLQDALLEAKRSQN